MRLSFIKKIPCFHARKQGILPKLQPFEKLRHLMSEGAEISLPS